MKRWIFLHVIFLSLIPWVQAQVYLTNQGQVVFRSEAPLELIQATSQELRGAIDASKNSFAFTIPMSSFHGFNSPLQEEHFCEKFLECHRHSKATFLGRILEEVDFSQPGTYEIRAKGKLSIHGVTEERIIRSRLTVGEDGLTVQSDFSVRLADHDVRIPQVVYQKIAEDISVKVSLDLKPQQP
ncbi:MAG: YceI family protein [Bacteroidota bacterium]